ncbi:hypothetical protein PR202_gb22676 [Eleusine coracana subsp. coracana]|uniref:Protein kinase domain-containing protein n=1 Tax=Eleusine coracana subsp. coracana TaxID=191504 RepID=A0AAV5FGY0_ELECO|nr:hypothetical protein PR202_gb22676 [Eleusine coracana subsp. coracana]
MRTKGPSAPTMCGKTLKSGFSKVLGGFVGQWTERKDSSGGLTIQKETTMVQPSFYWASAVVLFLLLLKSPSTLRRIDAIGEDEAARSSWSAWPAPSPRPPPGGGRRSRRRRRRRTWRRSRGAGEPRVPVRGALEARHERGFAEKNRLGRGGFGPVYRGRLEDDREVAVKLLGAGSRQGAKEFRNEATLLSRLQHRNVVNLFGYCTRGADDKLLVYEYVSNESLDKILFSSSPGTREFFFLSPIFPPSRSSPSFSH